ncbi:hypothetical protein ABN034_05155 [Actinopolymorpha sp. B11F2]|uniref:hypothetical protein n=1 Tax=Actinopolymorpha sp. B11F2 TaxID=3160862 RepID=UPI0032E38998
MARIRWVHVAMVLAVGVTVAAAGCGADQPVTTTGLHVLLDSAEIRGGEGIAVERLPAGTLHHRAPLTSLVLVKPDREMSIAGLVRFAGKAERAGDGAVLGVTGMCGQGWTTAGDPIDEDPCAAADYITDIPAGQTSTLRLKLYATTEAGPVTPGTYDLTIPLGDAPRGPLLDLRYRIARPGQVDLPPWPDETARLAITFEPDGHPWWELRQRIEDGYGRVVDERHLADYEDDQSFVEGEAVFTVDVPRGLPLHTVLQRREGDSWVRCHSGITIVLEQDRGSMTPLTNGCFPP